jgi:hypothetical protein
MDPLTLPLAVILTFPFLAIRGMGGGGMEIAQTKSDLKEPAQLCVTRSPDNSKLPTPVMETFRIVPPLRQKFPSGLIHWLSSCQGFSGGKAAGKAAPLFSCGEEKRKWPAEMGNAYWP